MLVIQILSNPFIAVSLILFINWLAFRHGVVKGREDMAKDATKYYPTSKWE